MRYAILSILLLSLLFGCNRDASNATSSDGKFLAPANQPAKSTMPDKGAVTKMVENKKMIEGPNEAVVDDVKVAEEGLTDADIAAAKRPGSRRTPSTADQARATSVPEQETPRSMPTPAASGKPVLDYDRPLFAVSKTACYGECEQYSLTLTNDRQLILNAKKHMDKKGEYRLRLNAQEYNSLISGLDSLNLDQLPAVFPRDIETIPADVQATVLRFPESVGSTEMKKVEVYFDAPDQLASFLKRFEAMVARKDWVAVKP
ncbi:DUF6438 domain-containing protein [Neolewinella persica]|uniref:DUF6438 domain-containing protein n=1 Tax=Neolewinella persica TaxID=70998 RepID=UPI00037A7C72|nr:DUF6438 domain-containing protein [Neolewinella persica]